MALNFGVPPAMAANLCNQTNRKEFKGTEEQFKKEMYACKNTIINTIKAYTDVDYRAIPRRKTGSKQKESAWAIARSAFCKQLLYQLDLGRKVDNGEIQLKDCDLPPLWKDGILSVDEHHSKVVLPVTLKRIVEAEGTYIEDSVKDRHGARKQLAKNEEQERKQRVKIQPAPGLCQAFHDLMGQVRAGQAKLAFDLTVGSIGGEDDVDDEDGTLQGVVEVVSVDIAGKENDGDDDDDDV